MPDESALDMLTNGVNNAVLNSASSTDPNALPTALNLTFSQWLSGKALPLLTGAAIFVTVLFVFYGAFLYFTAYGDENKATQAKKTLTFAMIGFSIALMSLPIINYVKRSFITEEYEQKETAGFTGTAGGSGGSSASGPGSNNPAPIQAPGSGTINNPDINPGTNIFKIP